VFRKRIKMFYGSLPVTLSAERFSPHFFSRAAFFAVSNDIMNIASADVHILLSWA
jgi:hypothetical protein